MIKLTKPTKPTKTMKTKEQKLIDILRDAKKSNDDAVLVSQSKQGDINTRQEILNLEGKINQQDVEISLALQNNPFSATKLYVARKEKKLLKLKLVAIKAIHAELF